MIATIMGDFGADVIKVEHPSGDSLRSTGWVKDGVALWWALASRNKRCVTLNLSVARGQELLKRLVGDADVLIENFRPATLERWNLDPSVLHDLNPGLVIVRVSGFGQTGPYAERPGFGTLAESMSGFAHLNGWPDTPPTLPPTALGDGVAAMTGCFTAMFALWWREHGGNGAGQVIDLSIFEPLFWILGPQALVYDSLGVVPERSGNRLQFAAPRNIYRTSDGQWLAVSATAQSVAERLVRLVGREDLVAEPWFADNGGRVAHADELDAVLQEWIGERTARQVTAAFVEAQAAIAPVYSIADIVEDPQYLARDTLVRVEHPVLGEVLMQNAIVHLSETPGRIDHPGPGLGEHNEAVYIDELGLSRAELAALKEQGVV